MCFTEKHVAMMRFPMIEKIINSDEKSIFLNYEVVIIGGGPAGLAASIEVKKSGVEKALLLERDTRLGGICFNVFTMA